MNDLFEKNLNSEFKKDLDDFIKDSRKKLGLKEDDKLTISLILKINDEKLDVEINSDTYFGLKSHGISVLENHLELLFEEYKTKSKI